MAWFRNHYECPRCEGEWQGEWSSMCDDDCALCGMRHVSPYESDDLTTVIERLGTEFIVLWSPETAEHDAAYRELGRFPTRSQAEAFLAVD